MDGESAHLDAPSGIKLFLSQSVDLTAPKDDSFATRTVPYTHANSLSRDFNHAHTNACTDISTKTEIKHSFHHPYSHMNAQTLMHSLARAQPSSARAATASCGHVSARKLLMGNHHGNQCHVVCSRSPGSLPFPFSFIPSVEQENEVG